MGGFAINGDPFEMAVVNQRVRLGDTEKWVVSTTMLAHPFHVHGVSFQVVRENGRDPLPESSGWKDTVVIDGETELLMRFISQSLVGLEPCLNLVTSQLRCTLRLRLEAALLRGFCLLQYFSRALIVREICAWVSDRLSFSIASCPESSRICCVATRHNSSAFKTRSDPSFGLFNLLCVSLDGAPDDLKLHICDL